MNDKLENKLHNLVCEGTLTLSSVRPGIAKDGQAPYKSVFGIEPSSSFSRLSSRSSVRGSTRSAS